MSRSWGRVDEPTRRWPGAGRAWAVTLCGVGCYAALTAVASAADADSGPSTAAVTQEAATASPSGSGSARALADRLAQSPEDGSDPAAVVRIIDPTRSVQERTLPEIRTPAAAARATAAATGMLADGSDGRWDDVGAEHPLGSMTGGAGTPEWPVPVPSPLPAADIEVTGPAPTPPLHEVRPRPEGDLAYGDGSGEGVPELGEATGEPIVAPSRGIVARSEPVIGASEPVVATSAQPARSAAGPHGRGPAGVPPGLSRTQGAGVALDRPAPHGAHPATTPVSGESSPQWPSQAPLLPSEAPLNSVNKGPSAPTTTFLLPLAYLASSTGSGPPLWMVSALGALAPNECDGVLGEPAYSPD